MIHHVASANIVAGKEKEAEQWLLKVAAFVNQKFPGANSQVLRHFDGKGNRIHLMDTWESVGVWEVASNKTEADPGWQPLMQKAEGLFDFDSFERHFYRVVSAS